MATILRDSEPTCPENPNVTLIGKLWRGRPLMTKEFAAETKGAVCLDFFEIRFAHLEEKLSQLTLWVIEAERARQPYVFAFQVLKFLRPWANAFSLLPARFESVPTNRV